MNCGVGTNMEDVTVDHFVTVLEEYEEYWVRLVISPDGKQNSTRAEKEAA